MNVHEAVMTRRTIRQYQPRPVVREALERLVDAGRLAPSAANLQPLEFIVVDEPEVCARVFPALKWAAYIHPHGDPKPGQEPQAYIFVLVNTKVREKMYEYDVGAAVEAMAVSAWSEGIGSCWLISIDRARIQETLGIPEPYRVDSVLALGYPAETSTVEDYADSPRYWKNPDGSFHVPKRKLRDVCHFNAF
ncbi:MAG: nitroreductase family protein [Candidatus Aminicenantes bacterium]|nr:nitroreductase family protein [Candidatus Aminicenantes bacterium]